MSSFGEFGCIQYDRVKKYCQHEKTRFLKKQTKTTQIIRKNHTNAEVKVLDFVDIKKRKGYNKVI